VGNCQGGRVVRNRVRNLFAAALSLAAPAVANADWPFTSNGPRRGSEAWYAARACDPVGERQKCKNGKLWPPFARPCGEEQTCKHTYHAVHYWPYPYNLRDREDVRMTMQAQVANGWATATTLYEYHFDPVTHQLNGAGRQHLSWIVTQAPLAYRQIYVSMAADPAFNEVRTLSVQKTLASLSNGDTSMPVTLRATDPLGRPATEVEQIFEGSLSGALPPTIQYLTAGSAGN